MQMDLGAKLFKRIQKVCFSYNKKMCFKVLVSLYAEQLVHSVSVHTCVEVYVVALLRTVLSK